jgi:hypothetical protein
MAKKLATSKPFSPTVHVLVIPTQLPLDMQHAFRDLDESEMVRSLSLSTWVAVIISTRTTALSPTT